MVNYKTMNIAIVFFILAFILNSWLLMTVCLIIFIVSLCQNNNSGNDSENVTYKCKKCRAKVGKEDEFCPECGRKFKEDKVKCKKCKTSNPNENKFCSKCGERLNTEGQDLEKIKNG